MKHWMKAALAAPVALLAVPALAEVPWRLLDQRIINVESGDRQVIGVTTDQRFDSVRLCVSRQPILIRQVSIRFREGGARIYQLNSILQNLRCTGDIILTGGARALADVTVSYNAAGLSRRGVRLQLHAR